MNFRTNLLITNRILPKFPLQFREKYMPIISLSLLTSAKRFHLLPKLQLKIAPT